MRFDHVLARMCFVWQPRCLIILVVLLGALVQEPSHSMAEGADTVQFLRKWGGEGDAEYLGQFNHPYAIAVAADGSIYVADTYNNRIQQFQADGTFIRKWGSLRAARFIRLS